MGDFIASLTAKLSNRGIKIADFYDASNAVEKRIMKEYGAIFLNPDVAVKMPNRCRFKDEKEVSAFQGRVKIGKKNVGSVTIELQEAAMDALLKAVDKGGKITPKGGNPARRSFAKVQTSWDSTVREGADYWKANANAKGKKLSAEEAKALKSMTGEAQIKRVVELEAQDFSFHSDRKRTIAVLTAIPGASQHLLMLALDVVEYTDKKVRDALNENGWFQTVFSDRPHFTYLGLKRGDLKGLGLKLEEFEKREFWIPDI